MIGSLQGGGAERQLSEMANYWAARSAKVTVATWRSAKTEDFYALEGHISRAYLDANVEGRSTPWSTVQGIVKLRRLLSSEQPDVVLSFLTRSNVLTILAGKGVGARIIVSERTQPAVDSTISSIWRLLRRTVYSWADEVVVQTSDAGQWIEKHCRRGARVIPNALRPLPALSLDREPLVVAIGRLGREKGFDLLLEAFARVAPDFPDWRVAIIGSGPESNSLASLTDQLKLSDRVSFPGHLRNVESWMARAALVVQPSRFEGFPNAVLEGMGMGAAVISSNCLSGPSDLIEHDVNGCLVPVGDVSALAEAMARLMSKPDIRERLGREAQKVRQRFRRESIMNQWEACFGTA